MYIILLLSSFELQLYLTYACSLIPRLSLPLEFDMQVHAMQRGEAREISSCILMSGASGRQKVDIHCIEGDSHDMAVSGVPNNKLY